MSAGLQTSQPLALGLNLETGPTTLTAQGFSVPVTIRDAGLSTTLGGVDMGTSFPLQLGLLMGTGGVVGYSLTAQSFAIPVTVRSATLTLDPLPADTIESPIVWPAALAAMLAPAVYSLTAQPFSVGVNFAPSDSTTETVADAAPLFGGRRPQARFRPKTNRLDEPIQAPIPPPIVKPAPAPRVVVLAEPDIRTITKLTEQLVAKRAPVDLKAIAEKEAAKKRKAAEDEFLLMF